MDIDYDLSDLPPDFLEDNYSKKCVYIELSPQLKRWIGPISQKCILPPELVSWMINDRFGSSVTDRDTLDIYSMDFVPEIIRSGQCEPSRLGVEMVCMRMTLSLATF